MQIVNNDIMDIIQQTLLDYYKTKLRLVLPTEVCVSGYIEDTLRAFKMSDIETLSTDLFRQIYQSRFTPKEFRQIFFSRLEDNAIFRFFTNDFLKNYLTQEFRRSVGIYVDDNFYGELPPNLLCRNDRYKESSLPNILYSSAQIYIVSGSSTMAINLVDKHEPHIIVRDNSHITLNNGTAFFELVDNASVTIGSGCEKSVIIKHDNTVTINDNSGKAQVISNPRSIDAIPYNFEAFRTFINMQ